MENPDGTNGIDRQDQVKHVYPEQEQDIILNNDKQHDQNKEVSLDQELTLDSKLESDNGPVSTGLLDLIYGTLFDPVRTFAGFARNPRISTAVIIFVILNLLEALMSYYTTPRFLQGLSMPGIPAKDYIKSTAMFLALGGFIFSLIKWFMMAGLLNLLSELLGGKGNARSVFAVYGIAGLPVLLLLPVEVLLMILPGGFPLTLASALFGMAILIWSIVLLIIGVREVHRFSTGKAVLAVLTPGCVVVILAIVSIAVLGASIAGSPAERFI